VVRVDLAESQTKPQVIRISAWCIFFHWSAYYYRVRVIKKFIVRHVV